MNRFAKNVKLPDLWGWAKTCPSCGWNVSPEGAWRRIDVLFPLKSCPQCSGRLILAHKPCAQCGALLPIWRFPRNLRQALSGGHTCRCYGCEIDKWEPFIQSWLPESQRMPFVSLDDRAIFPLRVTTLLPEQQTGNPLSEEIK